MDIQQRGEPHWGTFILNSADTQHHIENEMYQTFQMSQTYVGMQFSK